METERNFYQEETPKNAYHAGRKELVFAALTVVFGLALCNSIYAGGYQLGFGLSAAALILSSAGYLWSLGFRSSFYAGAMLACSVFTALGFGWSDDGFVKFVMFWFLLLSAGLGLCLTAKQNRRNPGTAGSVWDGPGILFRLGLGKLPEACQGLGNIFRREGAGKRSGAVLLGLCLAVPVVAVVISLLSSADAAFQGLLAKLPEWDARELLTTVLFGLGLGLVLYAQGVGMKYAPAPAPVTRREKGLSALTVNTLLGCLCAVYLVYLLSQLAYLAGGFSGLLPEGYSFSEYARRGFFEMAVLCVVNLSVMTGSLSLVEKKKGAPRSTRLLCFGIGLVTVFLVCASSAKMFMYIDSFGMSRLRLLTQLVTLFLGVTTVTVCVWLFVQKLPYMKVVLLGAMLIGLAAMWLDVDCVVARYNVDAYLSGRLETVDVRYLESLSSGSQGQLKRLAENAPDGQIARRAREALWEKPETDLRAWNYMKATIPGK